MHRPHVILIPANKTAASSAPRSPFRAGQLLCYTVRLKWARHKPPYDHTQYRFSMCFLFSIRFFPAIKAQGFTWLFFSLFSEPIFQPITATGFSFFMTFCMRMFLCRGISGSDISALSSRSELWIILFLKFHFSYIFRRGMRATAHPAQFRYWQKA